MLQTETPALRRFWYPVMPVEHLKDGPKPFTLLGRNIVLWLDGEGKPAALDDRCCHRTAKLSKGFYSNGWLACGYHGWEFGSDGRVMRVPQRPVDKQGATNMRVPSYRAEARYGYVWVALDEPLFDIPDFEEEAEGFRRIDEFYEVWNCAGLRLMENSFDMAHLSYVHAESFGILAEPRPAPVDIEHTPWGFVMRGEAPVTNKGISKDLLKTDSERTVRVIEGRWFLPFMRASRIDYPTGLTHVLVTAATPIDDRRSMICQWVYRNDTEADAPAEKVIAFDRQVTNEDRTILESSTWDVPLNMSEELHMPSDRPGIEMRRRLAALLAEHGEEEARLPKDE
jgi:phenylpropionate dioxygenase-like ring-hydroxylating dioxygenase large terminal subunit